MYKCSSLIQAQHGPWPGHSISVANVSLICCFWTTVSGEALCRDLQQTPAAHLCGGAIVAAGPAGRGAQSGSVESGSIPHRHLRRHRSQPGRTGMLMCPLCLRWRKLLVLDRSYNTLTGILLILIWSMNVDYCLSPKALHEHISAWMKDEKERETWWCFLFYLWVTHFLSLL